MLVVVAVAAVACALTAAPATAAPSWAPASSAAIRPGVQTLTAGGQCTANFVFYDAANVYLGQAAHCSGTGAATETDGCDSVSLPLGTADDIGGSKPGTAYNSWLTMQAHGEANADTCAYNDLALVKVDPADVGKVNPSSLGDGGGGWSHTVYTVTPGIPGDSGSAFLSADGKALGVLSTVALAPLAGSHGVGDLARELAYLNSTGGFSVTLATGTEPFRRPATRDLSPGSRMGPATGRLRGRPAHRPRTPTPRRLQSPFPWGA